MRVGQARPATDRESLRSDTLSSRSGHWVIARDDGAGSVDATRLSGEAVTGSGPPGATPSLPSMRRWFTSPCTTSPTGPPHCSPEPCAAPHHPSSSALTGRGDVLLRMASRGRCADRLLTEDRQSSQHERLGITSSDRTSCGSKSHPWCIAVLGRFRVERRANGEASSAMASAGSGGKSPAEATPWTGGSAMVR
jgi:hypothetical protein